MNFFSKKEYRYSNIKLIDMLPVGSIVELYELEGKYMITNYKGFEMLKEDNRILYNEVDYWCLPYPLGCTIEEQIQIPINEKDIKKIIFQGYNSKERLEFLSFMDSIQGGNHEE